MQGVLSPHSGLRRGVGQMVQETGAQRGGCPKASRAQRKEGRGGREGSRGRFQTAIEHLEEGGTWWQKDLPSGAPVPATWAARERVSLSFPPQGSHRGPHPLCSSDYLRHFHTRVSRSKCALGLGNAVRRASPGRGVQWALFSGS